MIIYVCFPVFYWILEGFLWLETVNYNQNAKNQIISKTHFQKFKNNQILEIILNNTSFDL